VLDWELRATPARWWGTHRGSFDDRRKCRRMMRTHIGKLKMQMIYKYDGKDDPRAHLAKWAQAYGEKPQPEWVHLVLSYPGYCPNELVCRNRAPPWDR